VQPVLLAWCGSLLVITGLFLRAGVVLSRSWADGYVAGTLTAAQRRTPLIGVPIGASLVFAAVAQLSTASGRAVSVVLLMVFLAAGAAIWVREPAWSKARWMRTGSPPRFSGSRVSTIVWAAVIADAVGMLLWLILAEGGSPYALLPLLPFGLGGAFLGISRWRRDG
jgi:hypothetical protein